MDRWMKDSRGDLEEMAISGGLVDKSAVKALWKNFCRGRLHWSRAWALTVLGATANDVTAKARSTGSNSLTNPAR
jgi:hypothetical protein